MNKLIYALMLLTLPETLALVNGVKITNTDLKKATGEQVGQLQQQVIEARKRELDLMINSKSTAAAARRKDTTS